MPPERFRLYEKAFAPPLLETLRRADETAVERALTVLVFDPDDVRREEPEDLDEELDDDDFRE